MSDSAPDFREPPKPPADSAPLPPIRFPTREEALSAARGARGWEELFEVGNQALRVDRRAWGDDEEQSAGAAMIWAQMCFPVSAGGRVGFVGETDKRRGAVCLAPGAELVRLGFELAREAAAELLAPLPALPPGALSKASRKRAEPLDVARRRLLLKSNQATGLLRSICSEARLDPQGSAPRPVGLLEEALCGRAHRALREPAAKSRARARRCGQSTWALMAELAGVDLPEGAARAAGAGADPGAAERLRFDGGFALVSLGPMGGWGAALALAGELSAGCRDLGRALGLPSQVAGLGGMAARLNYHMDSAGAAFYEGAAFAMGFAPPLSGLGHEWSHALDSEVRLFGDPAAKAARSELCSALRALPTDQASAARAGAYDQDAIEEDVGALGSLGAVSDKAGGGGSEVEAERSARDLFENVRRLCEARGFGPKDWGRKLSRAEQLREERADEAAVRAGVALVEAARGPWEGAEPAARALGVVEDVMAEERRRSVVRRWLALGESSYLAWARAQDWLDLSRYWSETEELIARAAEPYFAALCSSEALAPQDMEACWLTRESLPRGSERDAAVAAFGRWIAACRPWLAGRLSLPEGS